LVEAGGTHYRRNRRHLIVTNEQQPMEEFEFSEGSEPDTSQSSSPQLIDEPSEMGNVGEDNNTQSEPVDSPTVPRRSGRLTRQPKWMEDYIPSI